MSRLKIILVWCCSYMSKVYSYEKDKYLSFWTSNNESWNIYTTARAPHIGQHWEWKSFTSPPYKHENVVKKIDSRVYCILFLIVMILLLIVAAYGIYFFYKKATNPQRSNVNGMWSSYISHIRSTPVASGLPTTSRNITTDASNLIVNIRILQTNSMKKDVVDQPPIYDDVIQDNINGKNKFPKVTRCSVESPPPTYDDAYKMRY